MNGIQSRPNPRGSSTSRASRSTSHTPSRSWPRLGVGQTAPRSGNPPGTRGSWSRQIAPRESGDDDPGVPTHLDSQLVAELATRHEGAANEPNAGPELMPITLIETGADPFIESLPGGEGRCDQRVDGHSSRRRVHGRAPGLRVWDLLNRAGEAPPAASGFILRGFVLGPPHRVQQHRAAPAVEVRQDEPAVRPYPRERTRRPPPERRCVR